LGRIVKPLERVDGSLILDEVMQKVASSTELRDLWDRLVQDTLLPEESFKLLHALCYHFCVTWRAGIISRRKDELNASTHARQKWNNWRGFQTDCPANRCIFTVFTRKKIMMIKKTFDQKRHYLITNSFFSSQQIQKI